MSLSILEIALKLERREKPMLGSNINDIIESLPENQPDTVGGGGYRLIKQYTNCWLLEHCKINVGKTIIKPEW